MKLTIDCVLNHDLSRLQSDTALSHLFAKGAVTVLNAPLEAMLCMQFGLDEVGDFSIAAISAAADDIEVGTAYWLRADPVHFMMQRDSFSLSEPAPLSVNPQQAALILASLNQHFAQDGLNFCNGKSGAWYVKAEKLQHIQTTLPSVAMDKNVHQFMPQGQDASKWKAILNEVQMLLYDHPVNHARELSGEVAVNSVWFSGGGIFPVFHGLSQEVDLMMSHHVLSIGLANWAQVTCQKSPTSIEDVLQKKARHVRLELPQEVDLDKTWFEPILKALKHKQIEQLTLNLGFYEKTIVVVIKPIDMYKFWRKNYAFSSYLA